MKQLIKNRRYEIIPQMVDYDFIGESWFPYVMNMQKTNISLKSVSTDQYGFRSTTKSNYSILLYEEFVKSNSIPKGLLIGNSTAFGVGASSE